VIIQEGSPKCTLSTCCWTIELWYQFTATQAEVVVFVEYFIQPTRGTSSLHSCRVSCENRKHLTHTWAELVNTHSCRKGR